MHLHEIQAQVGSGSYRVDPLAVADAIVHRLLLQRPPSGPGAGRPQGECS